MSLYAKRLSLHNQRLARWHAMAQLWLSYGSAMAQLWLSYGSAMAELCPPPDLFQQRPRDRACGAVAPAGLYGLAVLGKRYA